MSIVCLRYLTFLQQHNFLLDVSLKYSVLNHVREILDI